ncbi:MAG: hypothetical protein AAF547_00170 [Actinomycetota bacterium]
MSFIPVLEAEPPIGAADPTAVPPIAELRGVFAHFPTGLGAFDQMYQRMVGKGRLDRTLRFVILGASARWRNDPFIASAMFRQAIDDGLTAVELGDLIGEAESGDPIGAEATLLGFCRKATETAFKMIQRDVDALRTVGWTNGQIVEAVTMVSLSGYMTVMAAGGGLTQTPGLEAEPWR